MFEKVKNFFMDEPEEEQLTKDVIHVEIPAPKEELKREVVSDSSTIRREEKFKTPVYFDDKDFDTLYNRNKEKPPVEQAYKKPEVKVEKKYFQPSPVISPVYGILDKNYHKDDITNKKKNSNDIQREKKANVDDVRKKAFGTLVDDLESTLTFRIEDVLEPTIDLDDDMFNELDFNLDSNIDDFEDKTAVKLDYVMKTNIQKQPTLFDDLEDKKMSDDELFGLIDMMHERDESDDNLLE
jgi:hypothetical protein